MEEERLESEVKISIWKKFWGREENWKTLSTKGDIEQTLYKEVCSVKMSYKEPKPQDTGISVFLTFPQDGPTFFPEKSSFLINFLPTFASVQLFCSRTEKPRNPRGWPLDSEVRRNSSEPGGVWVLFVKLLEEKNAPSLF